MSNDRYDLFDLFALFALFLRFFAALQLFYFLCGIASENLF